jgi:hypothetical protein
MMMLVLGLVMSTAGAGLAVSGNSGSGNAALQAYPSNAPESDVLGEVGEVEEDGASAPQQAAQPEQAAAAPIEQAPVTNSGDELPFTGFAAGGVLFLGLVLLASGLVLRRRLSDQA